MTDSHHQGIWFNDSLHVSRNFVRFELGYQPWRVGPGAGGIKVAETKRETLDAGENLDRFEGSFKIEGKAPSYLSIGIGIARHQGGVARFGEKGRRLRSWEPLVDVLERLPKDHPRCRAVLGALRRPWGWR